MNRILDSRIASAFLLTFFVSFMNAEDVTSGSLSGNVLDQSGNAVSGASVVVKSASTGNARGTGQTQRKKQYRRADIIKLMKTDPERYAALSEEIFQAYAEGRVK